MPCMMCYELEQTLESAKRMEETVPIAGLSVTALRNRAHQAVEKVALIQHKLVRHKKQCLCSAPNDENLPPT
jgi:phosphotransacetylase